MCTIDPWGPEGAESSTYPKIKYLHTNLCLRRQAVAPKRQCYLPVWANNQRMVGALMSAMDSNKMKEKKHSELGRERISIV